MIALLLAAAAAGQTAPINDPDLRCMAGYLIVAGEPREGAALLPEDNAGVQALVMYYFGKLDARHPGADLESLIKRLVQAPGYAALLAADLQRCNAEATARGKYLETFGDGTDPPAPAKP